MSHSQASCSIGLPFLYSQFRFAPPHLLWVILYKVLINIYRDMILYTPSSQDCAVLAALSLILEEPQSSE